MRQIMSLLLHLDLHMVWGTLCDIRFHSLNTNNSLRGLARSGIVNVYYKSKPQNQKPKGILDFLEVYFVEIDKVCTVVVVGYGYWLH